jgi:anti-anti-sigma regulatory factor
MWLSMIHSPVTSMMSPVDLRSRIPSSTWGQPILSIDDALERYGESEPVLAEILSGLAYLKEDLDYRADERSRAQRALEEQNRELVESRSRLAALAAELSTPIIKVWSGVLLIPLIGSFDSGRAVEMVDRLMAAVVRERARFVILELTGVSSVDTATADHFLRIIGAVRLLGAEGIIAGVQPSVAMSMVSLGVDTSGIRTARDAEEALVHCQRSGRN